MLPTTQRDDQMWVDARSLHQALGVKRDFSNWIKGRLKALDATENEEYAVLDESPDLARALGRPAKRDYFLSLDLGKEVAMLEKNDTGKAVRRYFIDAEKELRKNLQLEMNDPLVLTQRFFEAETQRRALTSENHALTETVEVLSPKAASFDRYLSAEGSHDFKGLANMLGWGRNRRLEELRRKKILISEGKNKNLPYQRFIDERYFEVKARKFGIVSIKTDKITQTAFVTSRGVVYLDRSLNKPPVVDMA